MREPARDRGRLEDMLHAAEYVISFTEGLTLQGFTEDKLRYFAVLMNVEIIGEAAYMLTLDYKESHPQIPWDRIIKMRHILVHGYGDVLPEILWTTAKDDVPKLLQQIQQLLGG